MSKKASTLACALSLLILLSCQDHPKESFLWRDADVLFSPSETWGGADGAYSVLLPDDRVLWLFGDTFTSGDRASMVHNSVGIENGRNPLVDSMEYFHDIFPAEGDVFFWPGTGIIVDGRLVVFRVHVKSTPGVGLGFVSVGWSVVVFENFEDKSPLQWKRKVYYPNSSLPASMFVGSMASTDSTYLYVAAYDHPNGYLARWHIKDFIEGSIDSFEWWTKGGWSPESPESVDAFSGPEGSLHFDEVRKKWVIIRIAAFADPRIVRWTSDAPEGPWSGPEVVFTVPDKGVLVYAAKAHPEISSSDYLVVTYATNALTLAEVIANQSIYYPKFVKIPR